MFFIDDELEARCTWVPAIEAETLLKPHFGSAHDAHERIIKRAAASLIASKCGRMKGDKTKGQLKVFEQDDCLIANVFWERFEPSYARGDSNWVAGDFDLIQLDRYDGKWHTRVYSVQFCKEDLLALIPQPVDATLSGTSQPARRRQDLPELPEPIAQAWMRWLKSNPKPTKEGAEKSALHMFPNHNLSRDRVRDLFDEK